MLGDADGALHPLVLDHAIRSGIDVHAIHFALDDDTVLLRAVRKVLHLVQIGAVIQAADGRFRDIADMEIGVQRFAEFERFCIRIGGDQLHAQGFSYGDCKLHRGSMGPLRTGGFAFDETKTQESRAVRQGFCFQYFPRYGAGIAVSGQFAVRFVRPEPGPADRYTAADGFAGRELGIGRQPDHRFLAARLEGGDMRTLQYDVGERVLVGDFGNDHARGDLLELHVVADGETLVEFS